MRSTEVSPNPYGELGPVFEKGDVSVNEEKMNYPAYGVENKPYFTPFIRLNAKYIKDLRL